MLTKFLPSLLLVPASGFTTSKYSIGSVSSSSALGVSFSAEVLGSGEQVDKETAKTSIHSVFEVETPHSVGVRNEDDTKKTNKKKKSNGKKRRKHDYSKRGNFLNEQPDLDFYTLHSSAVSYLHLDIPINDITRAIKRAQNRHDVHDLQTIGAFLMKECDNDWGYGFRGSLLSRLAVAALHAGETKLALQAIATRRQQESQSIQPFESSSIVRGLLRNGLLEEGWEVLEDELGLPVSSYLPSYLSCSSTQTSRSGDKDEQKEDLLKHRATTLSSIVTRYFHQAEPKESLRALKKLEELGTFLILESSMDNDIQNLDIPWERMEEAAVVCNSKMDDPTLEDFRDYVSKAMKNFPNIPSRHVDESMDEASKVLAP